MKYSKIQILIFATIKENMKRVLSYPLSVVFYVVFGFWMILFHPIQWVCFNFFGYGPHKKSVDILNGLLLATTYLLGTTYKTKGLENIPEGEPLILVSNHQSMYDVSMIIWFLKKYHPKFISKIELGKGIPSVSYNLRHGGSVLIDRKDPKQALTEIKRLGLYIEQHQRSAVIFPEGTRSRDGHPKRFAENGLKILCKYAPSAYIVPLSINNSWKIVKNGIFPLSLGHRLSLEVHPPIKVVGSSFEELFNQTKESVVSGIRNI